MAGKTTPAKKTTKASARKSIAASTAKARKAATEAKKAAAVAQEKAALVRKRVSHGKLVGFVNFIREQGVIGLAVGLAIGTAAGDTVKKLVEGFITPIVQLLVGSQQGLEAATWQLEIAGRTGEFRWGAFVSSFITLTATAFVIYLIVHYAKLDRVDRKKED